MKTPYSKHSKPGSAMVSGINKQSSSRGKQKAGGGKRGISEEELKRWVYDRDVKNAAIHQAGQIVAALLTGTPMAPGGRIFSTTPTDWRTNKCVVGQGIVCDAQEPFSSAITGFAGAVAEELRDDVTIDIDEIVDYLNPPEDYLSNREWAMVQRLSPSLHYRAACACARLLQKNWHTVSNVAARLEQEFYENADGNTGFLYFVAVPVAAPVAVPGGRKGAGKKMAKPTKSAKDPSAVPSLFDGYDT